MVENGKVLDKNEDDGNEMNDIYGTKRRYGYGFNKDALSPSPNKSILLRNNKDDVNVNLGEGNTDGDENADCDENANGDESNDGDENTDDNENYDSDDRDIDPGE